MYANGKATPLTATKADRPPMAFIQPQMLANIAAITMLKSMGAPATIAFIKKKVAETQNAPLWTQIYVAFVPVAGLAPPLALAATVNHPYQREMVLVTAKRLQERCGVAQIQNFFDTALQSNPWNGTHKQCAWIAPITRWIRESDIPWSITAKPAHSFIAIDGCNIAVAKKDQIILLLMAMFRTPTQWGEKPLAETEHTMPMQVKHAFEHVPEILAPAVCTLHKAIASCSF